MHCDTGDLLGLGQVRPGKNTHALRKIHREAPGGHADVPSPRELLQEIEALAREPDLVFLKQVKL